MADAMKLLSTLGYWEVEAGRLSEGRKLAAEFSDVEWADLKRALTGAIDALEAASPPAPAREAVAWRYRYPDDTAWQLTQDHDQAFKNTGEVEPLGVIPFPALTAREEAPAEGAGLDPSEANDWLEWTRFEGGSAKIDEIKRAHEAIRTALRARTSDPAREAVALLRKVHSSALPIEMSKTFDWTVPASVIKDIDKYLDTHPAPETADKLREAASLLSDCIWLDADTGDYRVEHDGSVEKARAILAALNEEG